MTAASAPIPRTVRTPAEIRRARNLGIVYLLAAVLVVWLFGMGSLGLESTSATFGLARPQDPSFPDLTLNAPAVAFAVAAILAAMGGIQLSRGLGRWTNIFLAIGSVLFVFAFLGWATARSPQGTFSLVGMLEATVTRSVPITLGAISGVLCERVAVINIAIEGMLLGGAFTGVLVASALKGIAGEATFLGGPLESWIGILAAVVLGMLLAWALAWLAIKYRVDQIILGVVINIFVLGLTSFLSLRILAKYQNLNGAPIFKAQKVPLLGDIPVIGPVLFRHTIFVYTMFILVAVTTYGLFHTRWGLRARAVGEHPKAADTVGINVYRTRYKNVLLGGVVAGLGGAWFTLGFTGRFDENMTFGRGYIGLAAMIFGRWHPVGAMAAGLIFGFADALSQKLGLLQTGIPSEFLQTAPFLATILVVAGLVGRSRPPQADGQPYIKE
jgi:ABC-type uncharacterized transport system permease subunit